MSTVPQYKVALPSAAIARCATDVVGEMLALIPIATPRPRLIVPLPRLSAVSQPIRATILSNTCSQSGITHDLAGCVWRAVA